MKTIIAIAGGVVLGYLFAKRGCGCAGAHANTSTSANTTGTFTPGGAATSTPGATIAVGEPTPGGGTHDAPVKADDYAPVSLLEGGNNPDHLGVDTPKGFYQYAPTMDPTSERATWGLRTGIADKVRIPAVSR